MESNDNKTFEKLIALLKEGKLKEFYRFHRDKFRKMVTQNKLWWLITAILSTLIVAFFVIGGIFNFLTLNSGILLGILFLILFLISYGLARLNTGEITEVDFLLNYSILIILIIIFGTLAIIVLGLVQGLEVTVSGVSWSIYLFTCFGSVYGLGFYWGCNRIVGAGIIHSSSLNIIFKCEVCLNCDIYKECLACDDFFMDDFIYLLKGLDKWSVERFNVRFVNLNAIKQFGITEMLNNLSTFQENFRRNFNEEYLKLLRNYNNRDGFYDTVKKFSSISNVERVHFDKETIFQKMKRIFGISNIITIILAIISIIITLTSL